VRIRVWKLAALSMLAAAAVALTLTGAVGAHGKRDGKGHHGGKVLKAKLNGANEVPPADPDGRGKAAVKVLPRFGAVCFDLKWEKIGPPTMAHIHKGAKGVNGPVVVLFFENSQVKKTGCTDGLDQKLLRDIKRHPSQYYVNIHNDEFPPGAIRGQLKGKGHHRAH
jgi:CHRD domain